MTIFNDLLDLKGDISLNLYRDLTLKQYSEYKKTDVLIPCTDVEQFIKDVCIPNLKKIINKNMDKNKEILTWFDKKENHVYPIDGIIKMRKGAENIIFPGDYFLCDIISGELWLCRYEKKAVYVSERKEKLKATPIELIYDFKIKNDYKNGTWKVPECFTIKEFKNWRIWQKTRRI
ncbi:MAG: hypothetical protein WC428_05455 [Candidatus Paceibacterota bacterium]